MTRTQLRKVQSLYPHLFLTDKDIDKSSGAFRTMANDERHCMHGMYQRVVFKGHMADGRYKWGPAVDITDMEIVALVLGLELGEDQTVIVSESQMAHSRLDECDDTCEFHNSSCLICFDFVDDEGFDFEDDEAFDFEGDEAEEV